jgi:hypothetical protein
MTKRGNPAQAHLQWTMTLLDFSITIYTNGPTLDDHRTGAGWAMVCTGNNQEYLITEGYCTLGKPLKVYDSKIHAVDEALQTVTGIDTPISSIFIYIDNTAAIQTLNLDKENSELARLVI